VIKDNRRIGSDGRPKEAGGGSKSGTAGEEPTSAKQPPASSGTGGGTRAGTARTGSTPSDATANPTSGVKGAADPGRSANGPAGAGPGGATMGQPAPPVADPSDNGDGAAAQAGKPESTSPDVELDSMRGELDERLRDLQRVTAEYANYRKRVDRDRGLVAEQAMAAVIGALLPILDDIDRAREHGDLGGPFAAVADHVSTTLGKFGLIGCGEKGDRCDPTRHEAVAHQTSADVTEPTCVEDMRRGYLLGDRLLRAAMVAGADPE
jgi:molecular chaperone GrpE